MAMRETGYAANNLGVLNNHNSQASASNYLNSALSEREPAIAKALATMQEAIILSHRVTALVDRLCGSTPVTASKGDIDNGNRSIFEGIRSQAELTSCQINDAMAALNRLDLELP